MIVSLKDKLEEKKNIDELKECLRLYKEFKVLLNDLNGYTDDIIDSINEVTSDKANINIMNLTILLETQNRFTEISKDMLKILNELGIVKYTS